MTPTETKALQSRLGVKPDGAFGPISKGALFAALINRAAPAITPDDIADASLALGVSIAVIKAVREVEAPRGAFDAAGRPTILYERHVFGRQTAWAFNRSRPDLSASAWQPGTYGPLSAQYGKLIAATDLDLEAAFMACSWGAFQVLGENARALGYATAPDMALDLAASEGAHLDCFVRYVRYRRLDDDLRQCIADDPDSCIDFVEAYNGPGYARVGYHVKLAAAI